MKKKKRWQILLLPCALVLGLTAACDVTQTREGEMPEVGVEAKKGRLPEFDVDWADIDVGTTTRIVKVPKVVVVMEETEVEVPYLDFHMPNDRKTSERTLSVEAEIEGEGRELEIEEVYGTEDRLIVIASLSPTGESLDDERVRISDRLVINAPDLDVDYYIVGNRPEGDWNLRYDYIDSRSEIADELDGAAQIYAR